MRMRRWSSAVLVIASVPGLWVADAYAVPNDARPAQTATQTDDAPADPVIEEPIRPLLSAEEFRQLGAAEACGAMNPALPAAGLLLIGALGVVPSRRRR